MRIFTLILEHTQLKVNITLFFNTFCFDAFLKTFSGLGLNISLTIMLLISTSPNFSSLQLCFFLISAELGDFNLSEHDHNYLDGYEFAPNQVFLSY